RLPAPEERARRLASWLSQAVDVTAVKALLQFRAEVVHLVVIEYTPVCDADLVSRLLLTPGTVERIFATRKVDDQTGAVLLQRIYQRWRETAALKPQDDPPDRTNPDFHLLCSVLGCGLSFPPA